MERQRHPYSKFDVGRSMFEVHRLFSKMTVEYPVYNCENKFTVVYDAAMSYMDQNIALIVMGGKEYGTGSSRDWAAKGTVLLGIKAVIAQSFERIHRSNLVGMGVLPLVFKETESWESLGLDGSESFVITGIENMEPQKVLQVKAVKEDGSAIGFEVVARLDTVVDVDYFENGGILPYVLRKVMNAEDTTT